MKRTKLFNWIKVLFLFCITYSYFDGNAQNIQYGNLYTGQNFSNSLNLALPVGSIDGKDASGGSGASNYAIAVELPEGTNNIVPKMNIQYSSSSGNNSLGWGWFISGLSSITRTNRDIYHDGKVSSFDLSYNDIFLLDGNRLIATQGAYGLPNTTYGTELESYSKITSFGTQGNGPSYFRVLMKDGMLFEYGNTVDSKILDNAGNTSMIWRLNKVTDPNGNYIEYKYINDDRDFRIDEISYTGNSITGLIPFNKIKFYYKIRTDVNIYYDAGQSFVSKYLLDRIEIKEDNINFRTYTFKYGEGDLYSFLMEIEMKGRDGNPLNPTKFLYGEIIEACNKSVSSDFQNKFERYTIGDFDGDGQSDIMAVNVLNFLNGGTNNWNEIAYDKFSIYKKSSPNTSTTPTFNVVSTVNLPITTNTYMKTNYYNAQKNLGADYDGDGDDDILMINYTNQGNGILIDDVTIHLSNNGTSFSNVLNGNSTIYTNGIQVQGSIYPYSFYFEPPYSDIGDILIQGDFDGNGAIDFISFLKYSGQQVYSTKVTMTSPLLNEKHIEVLGVNFNGYYTKENRYYAIDFNGNGKTDLMIINQGNCYIYEFDKVLIGGIEKYQANVLYQSAYPTAWHTMLPGDFNGDGKTDLLTRVNDPSMNQWYISYSTGTNFSTKQITFSHNPNAFTPNNNYKSQQSDDRISLSDFNGDGKTDILVEWDNGNLNNPYHFYDLYYSKGQSLTNIVPDFELKQWSYTGSMNHSWCLVGDFNGDGRNDLFDQRTYMDPTEFVYFSPRNEEKLLKKVCNGIGHVTEYNYDLLTVSGSFYTKDNNAIYPLNDIQAGVYSLKSVKTPNGIGGNIETFFNYEGLKLHKQGRGLLGYRKVTSSNLNQNIKVETEKSINTTYWVNKDIKTKVYNTSTLVLTSIDENVDQFTNLGGVRYKVERVLNTKTNGLNNSVVTTSNTYDLYGNIILQSENVDLLETKQIQTTYGSFANTIPNKPLTMNVIKTRSGETSVSKHDNFNYDAIGRLISKTEFSNLPNSVTFSFVYDLYGNIITNSKSGIGLPSVSESWIFDSKGRYPTTYINPLSQSTYYSYFPLVKQNHVTRIDGINIITNYDEFGRINKVITQDPLSINDVEEQSSLFWNITGNAVYGSANLSTNSPIDFNVYDILGRGLLSGSVTYNNMLTLTSTIYNSKGQVEKESKPYFLFGTPIYINNTYDSYGRLINSTDPLSGTLLKNYTYIGMNLEETTTFPNGAVKMVKTEQTGKLISSNENNAPSVFYKYNSWGNMRLTALGNLSNISISNTYDNYGRLVDQQDMNSGSRLYVYDAFGRTISETNANGHVTNYDYDIMNRVIQRNGVEGITTYQYSTNVGTSEVNKIVSLNGFNGINESYKYNVRGSLNEVTKDIQGAQYITKFEYDGFENLISKEYLSSGLKLNYEYDANGLLTTILDQNLSIIYQQNEFDPNNQISKYTLGNGLTSTNTYNQGFLVKKETPSIQNYELNYNYSSGTISERRDNLTGLSENFSYDIFSRLTSASVNGLPMQVVSFAPNGNITKKTDKFGNHYSYLYDANKKNAVDRICNVQNPLACPPDYSSSLQEIAYTSFDRAEKITEDNWEYNLTYGPDYQRAISEMKNSGNVVHQRYYIGDMEVDFSTGSPRYIHYISGHNGLACIAVVDGGNTNYYYAYTDHLGSILSLTDQNGQIIAEQNFDPWGRNRNPQDWSYNNIPSIPDWLYRGYTGHEHIPEFRLINMNARLYDPFNGRMLSPDKFVLDPSSAQHLNRYSYALNNPMSITDPSGHSAFFYSAFLGELGSNLIYGVKDPFGKAYESATKAGMEVNGVTQLVLDQDENYSLRIGLDVVGLGVGIFFNGEAGDFNISTSAGIGMNGPFAAFNVSYHYRNVYLSASGGTNFNSSSFSFGGGYNNEDGWKAMLFFNFYSGNNAQSTRTLTVGHGKFAISEENDFFSSDKYRTQALTLHFNGVSVGTPIYTNDPTLEVENPREFRATIEDGTPKSLINSPIHGRNNSKQKYSSWGIHGKVLGSAITFGFNNGSMNSKIGISSRLVQDLFQNGVHTSRWFLFGAGNQNYYLNYSDFKSGAYFESFPQIGGSQYGY